MTTERSFVQNEKNDCLRGLVVDGDGGGAYVTTMEEHHQEQEFFKVQYEERDTVYEMPGRTEEERELRRKEFVAWKLQRRTLRKMAQDKMAQEVWLK